MNLKKSYKILVTLGPSSLNKNFLQFIKKFPVSYLRINMSHINVYNLQKTINFIRKYNKKTPICIDTEGAQIRTKLKKRKFIKRKTIFKLYDEKGNFNFYPNDVFKKLKVNDLLSIGFDNLNAEIIKKRPYYPILGEILAGAQEFPVFTYTTEFVEKVGLELNLAATGEKEIEKAMNAANKAYRKLLVKDGKLSN